MFLLIVRGSTSKYTPLSVLLIRRSLLIAHRNTFLALRYQRNSPSVRYQHTLLFETCFEISYSFFRSSPSSYVDNANPDLNGSSFDKFRDSLLTVQLLPKSP